MLVLTRKEGETIVIPDLGITVQIVRVRGNRVAVGVTARKENVVLRGELLGAGIVDKPPDKAA